MKIDYLHNHPQHVQTIAEWHYSEWGLEDYSVAETVIGLHEYCDPSTSLPLALIALENDELLGVCQLKHHELINHFPDLSPWLGGVFVPSSQRGIGIASKLVLHSIDVAYSLGIEKVYLHTKRLDGGIYQKLGWECLCIHQGRTGESLVMERAVDSLRVHEAEPASDI